LHAYRELFHRAVEDAVEDVIDHVDGRVTVMALKQQSVVETMTKNVPPCFGKKLRDGAGEMLPLS
jgi:hypothetical protein